MSEHTHPHPHGHTHEHPHGGASPAEQLALLNYMLGHNRSHTEDLHDLAHSLEGAPGELIHAAVEAYERGNEKLAEALDLLKGE